MRHRRTLAPNSRTGKSVFGKYVLLGVVIAIAALIAVASLLRRPTSQTNVAPGNSPKTADAGKLLALETLEFTLQPSDAQLTTEQKDRLLRQEQLDVATRLSEAMPENADAVFLTAMAHMEQGDSVEAARCLEQCLEMQPDHADAYDHLGRIAQEQGRHADAVTFFKRAGEIQPLMAGVHYRLGEAYQSMGKTEEAVSEVLRNVEQFPMAEDNYVLLGELYLQKRDYAAARANYEKAVELDPNLAKAYFGLASSCARLGLTELAAEYRRKFKEVEDDKRAVARERRTSFNPLRVTSESVAHTHTDVARVLNVRGRTALAEKLWRRAAELDPNNVTCRFGLADNLIRRNRPAEALTWYREIVRAQPDNGVAHFFIGHIHEKLGRLAEAETAYTTVTLVSPNRPEGFLALSQILFENNGDLERAAQMAARAAELSPTAANYGLLARIHRRRGDRAAALAAAGRAVQMAPQDPQYLSLQRQLQGN